jgi:hypothetical protein
VSFFGFFGEIVEEGVIELRVDQAGALTADLMRHAAGAEDHDLEILGIGLDRLAESPCPSMKQRMPGRRRVIARR